LSKQKGDFGNLPSFGFVKGVVHGVCVTSWLTYCTLIARHYRPTMPELSIYLAWLNTTLSPFAPQVLWDRQHQTRGDRRLQTKGCYTQSRRQNRWLQTPKPHHVCLGDPRQTAGWESVW